MTILDNVKSFFVQKNESIAKKVAETPPKKRKVAPVVEKSKKEIATENNEWWVDVINFDIDPGNVGVGSFELDWNPLFVARLVKAGYVGKTDKLMVNQWFTTICRNIALEIYEQEIADPVKRKELTRRELTDKRVEYS